MIVFEGISKIYKESIKAVSDFNLTVNDGEFLVIIGPSGCGKTSVLRMLAGLEKITSGTIKIDDKIINDIDPSKRGISMMFQHYALFPHLNVYDNIAFGLQLLKEPKEYIDTRVTKIAEMLDLKPFLGRKPKELSGGEAQRVALGRAIAIENKIVLFDEPLSNIDAKLKVEMRSEIRHIHDVLKNTTIYITHDQVEAMSLADRIVVMRNGFIEQIGTPMEIYDNPDNMFVGDFISKMNFIKKDKIWGFRPNDVTLGGDIIVKVKSEEVLGVRKNVYALLGEQEIVFEVDAHQIINKEERISINNVLYFDVDTKKRIRP